MANKENAGAFTMEEIPLEPPDNWGFASLKVEGRPFYFDREPTAEELVERERRKKELRLLQEAALLKVKAEIAELPGLISSPEEFHEKTKGILQILSDAGMGYEVTSRYGRQIAVLLLGTLGHGDTAECILSLWSREDSGW